MTGRGRFVAGAVVLYARSMGIMIQENTADILLVEDDESDAALAVRALKQRNPGSGVLQVMGGDEALEFAFASQACGDWSHTRTPKLILLDLKLRTISGLEVLRELKSQERTRSIPVVVLTTSPAETKIIESYRLGVNSFVIRPSDSRQFAEVIGEISHYWLTINKPPMANVSDESLGEGTDSAAPKEHRDFSAG